MKFAHQTWYRLADGTQADPNDVAADENGVLRHKSGVAVALRDSGVPLTCGARDLVAADDKPAIADREMKPAASSGKGYRTRSAKAG